MYGIKTETAMLAFLAVCVISCFAQDPVVSIVGPQVIRPGKPYRFSILANSLEKKLTVHVKLTGTMANGDTFEMNLVNEKISSGIIKDLEFNTDYLESGTYTLIVKTYDPSMEKWYEERQSLGFFSKQYSALMTTSKPLYKAGDMVDFRIFVIDSETRPVELSGAKVTITNPNEIKIKVFEDIEFVNGVFQSQLKLIDGTALGTWIIKLEALGESYVKTFDVEEFVLPTFSLEVDHPELVAYSESTFPIKISAAYTFGGPVTGTAEVIILQAYGTIEAYQKTVHVPNNGVTLEIDVNEVRDAAQRDFVKIDVKFTDEVSKKVVTYSSYIRFREYLYNFVYDGNYNFDPNVLNEFTLILRKYDGTPAPKGTPIWVDVNVGCNKYSENEDCVAGTISNSGYELDSAGSVSIEYTPINADYISINAVSPLSRDYRVTISPKNPNQATGTLNVEVLTENPMIGHRVEIKVTTSEDNQERCNYNIICKNVVLKSSSVEFKKNEAILKFTPSFDYAPYAKIIFYFYKSNGLLETRTITLSFNDKLPNYLNLKLSSPTVEPGNNFSLTIQSGIQSTVSLMAIDQRVLLLKTGNDIERSDVFNQINRYNVRVNFGEGGDVFRRPWWGQPQDEREFSFINMFLVKTFLDYPGRSTEPKEELEIPTPEERFEEAGEERNEESESNDSLEPSSPRVRKNFDEAFLWKNVLIEKKQNQAKWIQGEENIQVMPPDTITKWIISGVSMSSNYGMGLPDTKPELTVLLPFFIQLNLPHHVKRGEILEQDILIFSYLPNDQNVLVSVDRNDALFDVEEPNLNGWEPSTDKFTQEIVATSGDIQVLRIVIRPKIIGYIDIKVTAVGALAGDSVLKPLKVIPEGIPKSISHSVLIVKEDSGTTFSQSLKCDLPPTAVEDTTSAVATVVGDLLGDVLNNLEGLIRMSYGCGEQNMITIVPTIVVTVYLEATGQLTDELKGKAISYIENGYQRQLQFQRKDKSFSAFGDRDSAGSTWLTAYVVKSFRTAEPYITIDSSVMSDAINFILLKLDKDGSFREDGRVIHKDMQGGSSGKLSMTAYISIVLSEFIADPRYASNVISYINARDQAMTYIVNEISNQGSSIETYALAICSYALLLAKHPDANDVYQNLMSRRVETAEQIYWTQSGGNIQGPRSLDIEMTGYGLLAVLQAEDLVSGIKIVDYLVSQKNAFGGYGSSQDTAVALGALSAFAEAFTATVGALDLNLNPDIGNAFDVQVNSNNLLTVQSFVLDPYARMLDVLSGQGSTGTAIVSLTCNFYEVQEDDSPRFNIVHSFVKPSCKDFLRSYICLNYIPQEGDDTSNMVLMKMTLPSGYVYDTGTDLDEKIRKIEQEDGGTTLNVYLDSLSEKSTCFNIDAIRTCKVENLKASSIECMDYYDTTKMAQAFYNIPENLPNC